MQPIDRFANHFLIAMPHLDGSFFERSVTYVCEHNNEGAMGLVINQPLSIDIHDVLEELNIKINNPYLRNLQLVAGGPVQNQAGFIVHRDGTEWRNTFHPADQICITTSPDILEALAKEKKPIDAFMTLGFAGWEAGQLEKEVADNDWLICPADPKIIFDTPLQDRWKAALDLMGIKPSQLFHNAGHC